MFHRNLHALYGTENAEASFRAAVIRPSIKELLALMRAYKGVYFEPIVFPSSELHNDNPFVKEILRTGREIALLDKPELK